VVVDVPPANADPPEVTRGSTALEPGGQRRYRLGWVRIFYATDRNRADDPSPEHFFGGDRSPTNALEYGRIEVAVPRLHRPGVIERPAWYRINRAEWSDNFMRVQALTPLDQRAMLDSLRDVVSRSGGKEALVFIHGYNVSSRTRRCARRSSRTTSASTAHPFLQLAVEGIGLTATGR
jgi:esterase/lipase superfamily enzyme